MGTHHAGTTENAQGTILLSTILQCYCQGSFSSPVFTPLLDIRQQLFENIFNRPVANARSHIHKREFYFRYPIVRVQNRIKATT